MREEATTTTMKLGDKATQNDTVSLELTTAASSSPLALNVSESSDMRIQRLISENPVVIFSRADCCMCHAMKSLLGTVGVHPTVIELDEVEIRGGLMMVMSGGGSGGEGDLVPVLFVGGNRVGGLEGLVGLHLGGQLVPRLVQVGALQHPTSSSNSS